MREKGITLIEMTVVIVVLGISIPVLLNMWSQVAWNSSRSEATADAAFYAQQLMEEIRSKRFDEEAGYPWTASLGPDTTTKGLDGTNNETLTGSSNWDDIDDFNGYSDTPATGYTRSVTVSYFRLNASAWQSCSVASCVAPSNCTNCNECCYKRIQVKVSRANLASDVSLVTIVSGY